MTRANRALLSDLEPDFWRKSANADELHQAFITYQLANENLIKRVLERDGHVIGYAVSADHPSGFYFIDDVCLEGDADWLTDGSQLLRSIVERPAIMTAPHGDTARVDAARRTGLELIGTVRSLRFDREPALDLSRTPLQVPPPDRLVVAPVHPFLPAMAPEFTTLIGDRRGGYAVVSAPITAPPIYDPGGKPSVIDRVVGKDRQSLLMSALSFAAQRGDLGVILIVAAQDAELSAIADRLGARHPADIFKWPDQSLL